MATGVNWSLIFVVPICSAGKDGQVQVLFNKVTLKPAPIG